MLATPSATSAAEPGLNFVENQKDVFLVANLPQLPKPFAAEMIVAALTLNWFDDDRGNVDPASIDEFSDLRFRFFLALDHVAFALVFRQGKIDRRIRNPRPVEFGKQIGLARIRIGKAHGVAAASMEGAPKMQNLGAAFPTTGSHVFTHLPIHRRLQRVL